VLVDLVQVTTPDGVRLDGALQRPGTAAPPAVAVDSFCFVHGTGGNFYGSTLFDSFAERLLQLGCAVLRVNTRGHDGISTAVTARGGRRLGAAYEIVDECRHDLGAWVGWLRQQAGPRVGLVGHSLGAVKCVHALSREPALGAACLVALSPPRLSYSVFCAGAQGPEFLQTYALAERHLQAGNPEALLDVTLPLPYVITAGGYLEKYGPDERYNFLRSVAAVPCPTLVTLGGAEVATNVAFRGLPEALDALAASHRQLAVEVVAGADHFYNGVRAELIRRVEEWLRQALR
jgi:dienelactone hydrolase